MAMAGVRAGKPKKVISSMMNAIHDLPMLVARDEGFFRDEGLDVEILMTACQAPNLNAHTEQFVGSIRAECLDQVIFVGCASLERTIAEYVARDHGGRSHQGPENEIPSGAPVQRQGDIEVSGRLGGLLNYYHPQAA